MNDIQGGRWDELLRRLLPVKEKTVAPVIGPEIMPMMLVQPHEPEMYWLKNEQLASGHAEQAASPGNFNVVELAMPTTSPAIVVVESIRVVTPLGAVNPMELRWLTTSSGGAPVATGYRDSRKSTTVAAAQTVPTMFVGVTAAITGALFAEFHTGSLGGDGIWTEPIILGPGARLGIYNAVLNIATWCTITWRERAAEQSEVP